MGKFAYSVAGPVALRRGNVQKNALAKRHAICFCENVRLWLMPFLNNGIGAVIVFGSDKASWHMFGRTLTISRLKKFLLIPSKLHLPLKLKFKIKFSNSFGFLI